MRGILWLIAVVCIILFLLDFVGIYKGMELGNLIYILLVVAVIAVLYNLIAGRR